MEWALLIYAIDVLSTDGRYGGFGFLLFFTTVAYIGLWIARMMEAENADKKTINLHIGKVVTLAKGFDSLEAGENVVINNVDMRDETVKIRYPNGHISNWISESIIRQVAVPDEQLPPFRDPLKPLRRLVAGFAFIFLMGIAYANFMPSKETAYKMLAAYVGQTVVETPQVRETAGNAIDFLNKAIKKYSSELDADEAAKVKTETNTPYNDNKQEK